MPDDDQLSDLASVQILSHPHLAQIRSRSHQWPPRATVPEPLQAAGKLPCATTLSSLDAAVVTRRRRRVTSFAFPSGGAPTGASLHLRLPLRRRPQHRVRRLHLRHRLRPLRPAIPASSIHLRRDVQLGFRRRLRRRQPRLGVPPGPRPTACGPDQSSYVVRWQCVCVLYITSLRTKVLKEELLTTGTTNDKRGWGSRR